MALERGRYLLPVQSYGGYPKNGEIAFFNENQNCVSKFSKKFYSRKKNPGASMRENFRKIYGTDFEKIGVKYFLHHPHRPPLLSTHAAKFTHVRESHCLLIRPMDPRKYSVYSGPPSPTDFVRGDVNVVNFVHASVLGGSL